MEDHARGRQASTNAPNTREGGKEVSVFTIEVAEEDRLVALGRGGGGERFNQTS